MKQILDKAIVPISLLLANIANFIIQIVIPRNLSPVEYSQFTLAWSAGLFISALFFEWIRVFIIRYGQEGNKDFIISYRCTIIKLYKIISTFLLTSFVVILIFFYKYSVVWISSALFFAVFKGLFDGIQASDRANFRNQLFAQRWLLSSVLGLVLCLSVSYYTGTGYLSLISLSFSFPLAIVILNLDYLKQALLKQSVDEKIAKCIWNYGLFLSISTLIMSLFPFLLRFMLVDRVSGDGVAGLLLALEISGKTVLACGMFLNILLLQYVIKKVDSNKENMGVFMSLQVTFTAAVILPSSILFFAILQYFSNSIAPMNYLKGYLQYLDITLIFSLLMTLKLYAVDSLFAISGKTRYALIGSFSMILSIILVYIFSYSQLFPNIDYISLIIILPALLGLVISILCVAIFTPIQWDFKNIIIILLASIIMFVFFKVIFKNEGLLNLGLSIFISCIVYIFFILIFNIKLISKIKSLKG